MTPTDQETLRDAFVELFGEEPRTLGGRKPRRFAANARGLIEANSWSGAASVVEFGACRHSQTHGSDWRTNLRRAVAAVQAARGTE